MTPAPLSAAAWHDDPRATGDLGVRGASLVRLHSVAEARGLLTVGEQPATLPFEPRRFFVISRVPDENIRGEHAHRKLHQLLVCLAGSVTAEVDDGQARCAVVLDTPKVALHMAPLVWGAQHRYSADSVLLVLASHEYDAGDYIREYGEFQRTLRSTP